MGVFQIRGVCGQAFPSFPSPTPFLPPFCSGPIYDSFARPEFPSSRTGTLATQARLSNALFFCHVIGVSFSLCRNHCNPSSLLSLFQALQSLGFIECGRATLLVPCPLFQSTPLTESLEQATVCSVHYF